MDTVLDTVMDNKWVKGLAAAAGVIVFTASIALIVGVVRSRAK